MAQPVCGDDLSSAHSLAVLPGSFNPPHAAHVARLPGTNGRTARGSAAEGRRRARQVEQGGDAGRRRWPRCNRRDPRRRRHAGQPGDKDGYLAKACEYILAKKVPVSMHPNGWSIARVEDEALEGKIVLAVHFSCCLTGDVAFFDRNSGQLVAYARKALSPFSPPDSHCWGWRRPRRCDDAKSVEPLKWWFGRCRRG